MVRAVYFDLSSLDDGIWQKLLRQASEERKRRAQQCRKEETARQCILSEILLRYGLFCRYGSVPAYTVARTEGGKPFLSEFPDFRFNLSHCGKWVVFAWSDKPVGVDVQHGETEKPTLVRRHFTRREQDYVFAGETGPERAARFCRIWTAKESWLKYLGIGLTTGLQSFDVLDGSLPARFHWSELPDGDVLCICTPCEMVSLEQLAVFDLPGIERVHSEERA